MNKVRVGALVAGVLVVGGGIFMSSTFAGSERNTTESLTVTRHAQGNEIQRRVIQRVQPEMQVHQPPEVVSRNVELMAPPVELKSAPSPSSSMVTSIQPMAPVSRVVAPPPEQTAKRPGVQVARAKAQKPDVKNLFTLVRLLNYAPHPLNEELLKTNPLKLGENNYWFSLKYDEDWKVINDDEGYIKAISFEIDVMENNTRVRSMKTPKVAIDASKIRKGQILGIAEVAPYKFTISVDDFVKTGKGIAELVFKLDLVG